MTLDSGQASTDFTLDEGGNVEHEIVATPSSTKRDIDYYYAANRLGRRFVTDHGEGVDPDTTTNVPYQYNAIGDETSRQVTVQSTTTSEHEQVRTYAPDGHVSSVTHVPEGSAFDEVNYDGQVLAPPEGGWQVLYGYDLSNRLITRQEGGGEAQDPGDTVYFYWGTSNVLAEETDADGTPKRRYLIDAQLRLLGHQTWTTGPDGEVDTSQGIKWVWTLPDEQGNTATLLERDGTVVEQKAYGPYGRPDAAGTQRKDPDLLGDDWDPESILGFQSAPTDATSGNVLLGPRQYDPQSLRFTNSDTYTSAGLDLQLGTDPLTGNRYIFAAANPVAHYEDGHRVSQKSCLPYCSRATDMARQIRRDPQIAAKDVIRRATCHLCRQLPYEAFVLRSARQDAQETLAELYREYLAAKRRHDRIMEKFTWGICGDIGLFVAFGGGVTACRDVSGAWHTTLRGGIGIEASAGFESYVVPSGEVQDLSGPGAGMFAGYGPGSLGFSAGASCDERSIASFSGGGAASKVEIGLAMYGSYTWAPSC